MGFEYPMISIRKRCSIDIDEHRDGIIERDEKCHAIRFGLAILGTDDIDTDMDRFRLWLYDRAIGWLNRTHNYTWCEFDDDYVADSDRPVLGMRFEDRLRGRVAANMRLPPWFSNLLPEGVLRTGSPVSVEYRRRGRWNCSHRLVPI